MPDKDGKLSAEERTTVVNWLEQYPAFQHSTCPICGSEDWMLAEYLVQPVTLGPNVALQFGGTGYPQVMLISNPCGYTRLINAVLIGILPGSKPPEPEKPAP